MAHGQGKTLFGVPVRTGDHLVDLYSPELVSAQEELIQGLEIVESFASSESSSAKTTARVAASPH